MARDGLFMLNDVECSVLGQHVYIAWLGPGGINFKKGLHMSTFFIR